MDDLRDMKFNPPEFEGKLNPDLLIEWMQALERSLKSKSILMKRLSRLLFLSLKSMLPFGTRTLTRKGQEKVGKPRIRTWSDLKKLISKRFLSDNYKHDLYLRMSSLSQGYLSVDDYIREFEQLQIGSGI